MSAAPPRVSVLVPAWRSGATVEAFLEGLRRQELRDFEIVLVNSSPGDGTADVCSRFPEVRYVESPVRLLPHAARNRAIEEARGEVLVFTDPDVVPRPDWLRRLVAAVDAGHPVVAGAMSVAAADRHEVAVHLVKYWWLLPGRSRGAVPIAPTANAAYTREAFERAGPFDGSVMAGDALLSWHAARTGITPHVVPDAVVEHVHGQTLRALVRQRTARGAEYAIARARFEGWSRTRAAVALAALAPGLVVVVARAGVAALQAGWGRRWLSTLGWQIAGHAAWNWGEARGLAPLAGRGAP